jgi:hypothetical protein
MRTISWIFQCFKGIDRLSVRGGGRFQTQILGLQPLQHQILLLLGSIDCHVYFLSEGKDEQG